MIKVINIKKEFKIDKNSSEKVLKGISLELNEGFNVLYGPSGCGKSTLLNIISGLDTRYQGDVIINNNNLRDMNLDGYHQNEIGFIFQTFNLISHLSVLENVILPLYLSKDMKKQEREKIGFELLENVGLSDYAQKLPTQLSGGQKQRVAICRALVNDPSIIIADEPTGALDKKTGLEILNTLKHLSKLGKTVIVVTHDPKVKEFADNVYYLEDGVVKEHELINEVSNKSKSVKRSSGIGFGKSLKLAYKNFSSRFFRNILVSLASSIGIIGILLALGLGNGIDNGVLDIFGSILSPNSINVSAKSESGKPNFGPPSTELNQQQIDEIKVLLNDQGVTEVYQDEFYNDVTVSYNGEKVYAKEQVPYVSIVQKLDYKQERQAGYNVESEVLLSGDILKDDVNEVYITKDLAAILLGVSKDEVTTQTAGSLVGEDISLNLLIKTDLANEEYEFDTKIAGVLNQDTFATLIYASDEAFNQIYDLTGQNAKTFSITSYAKDAKSATLVAKEYKENEEYSFSTLGDVLEQISALTAAITITLAFVAGLSLVVAAVMICIVLYIGVIERTKEIGILRAVGYKARNIRFLFITEAVIIITIANVVAIVISLLIEVLLNPKVEELSTFKNAFSISFMTILGVYILTLVIAVLAGIYPANKAARVDPEKSLRME